MEYCFKNVGKEPANALGMVIAPGKVSRSLSLPELQLAWRSELPEGIKLVPILLEADVQKPTMVPEASKAPVKEPVAGAQRRGRPKLHEVEE